LDVNVGDDQIVAVKVESIANFSVLVHPKDGGPNDFDRIFVKDIKGHTGNGPSHARTHRFAGIARKIADSEYFPFRGRVSSVDVKVPVVRKRQFQSRMITGLNDQDVRHEVRSELQRQAFDYVWALRFVATQAHDTELLVGHQHDHVWAKGYTRRFALVIVKLDRRRGAVQSQRAEACRPG
jgi:hypothetical protein